jgi:hypothetical protein
MSRSRGSFLCHDCGRDVDKLGHYYTVHEPLWAATGLPKFGEFYLCLDDLEQRLGRPLTVEDFRLTTKVQWECGAWGGCARMLPYVSFPRIAKHIPVLAAWRTMVRRANPELGAVAAVAAFTQFWADHCHKRPGKPELLLGLYRHLDLVTEVI